MHIVYIAYPFKIFTETFYWPGCNIYEESIRLSCYSSKVTISFRESRIHSLHERIALLRITRPFVYLMDILRLLCSVRLALHRVCRINQRFLNKD